MKKKFEEQSIYDSSIQGSCYCGPKEGTSDFVFLNLGNPLAGEVWVLANKMSGFVGCLYILA
jgi:hypothetical protein